MDERSNSSPKPCPGDPTLDITRRQFLAHSAGAAAAGLVGCSSESEPSDGWDRGPLRHLLPAVSHRSMIVKASFETPRPEPPVLRVGDRDVSGTRTDSAGRFWAFRVTGLEPDREYTLQLRGSAGKPLCDPWPLRTFPAPGARAERMRALAFTCAGGISTPIPAWIFDPFRPPAYRRRLLALGLESRPDFAIANGDHVYYDLSQMGRIHDHALQGIVTAVMDSISHRFDPEAPVFGGANEESLIGVGDDQIVRIYDVQFRSTPVFFITDDHDYFENDDATPEIVTFPPNRFHRALRDGLQRLYFPELPADGPLPDAIPGVETVQGVRLSRVFGEVRYGDLFSGPIYDCGGYMSLGPDAGLIPPVVEDWLLATTRREDTLHHAHFPSHPMGWTAGKWREWYPDYLEHTDSLVRSVGLDDEGNKYMWQEGWWRQHQRIVAALSGQRRRGALTISGDLHALGALRMLRSGDLDLSANPVHTVLSGTVGTGAVGFPSRARGVSPRVPEALGGEALLPYEERNGFSVLECDREAARVATWRCPEGYVSPDTLAVERAVDVSVPRRA